MYRAERLYRSMGELPNHPNRVHIYQPFRNTPEDDPNLKILNGQLVLMILLKLRNTYIFINVFEKETNHIGIVTERIIFQLMHFNILLLHDYTLSSLNKSSKGKRLRVYVVFILF